MGAHGTARRGSALNMRAVRFRVLLAVPVVFLLLVVVSGECRGAGDQEWRPAGIPGSCGAGEPGFRGSGVRGNLGARRAGMLWIRSGGDLECRVVRCAGIPGRRAAGVQRIWSARLPGVQGIRGAGEGEFQGIHNTGEPGMLGMCSAKDQGCRGCPGCRGTRDARDPRCRGSGMCVGLGCSGSRLRCGLQGTQ